MPIITYNDAERAAPVVNFFGVEFEHKEPVDIDKVDMLSADRKALLEKAWKNPYFTVEGWAPAGADKVKPPEQPRLTREIKVTTDDDLVPVEVKKLSPFGRGFAAFKDGKKRSDIPVKYRGGSNQNGDDWRAGYDQAAAEKAGTAPKLDAHAAEKGTAAAKAHAVRTIPVEFANTADGTAWLQAYDAEMARAAEADRARIDAAVAGATGAS